MKKETGEDNSNYRHLATNLLTTIISLTVLFLLLEILTYLLICFNFIRPDFHSLFTKNFGASSMPYVKYDSVSGYKYMGKLPHLTFIRNGEIVYDHVLHVNNKGYCSVNDFSFRKKKGGKRWLVFGDSYSAGEITDTTWVDLFQRSFSEDSVEFYNFSLEGAGINGWHNIFFKEVIPHYEFDGIVIAAFGDIRRTSYDFARDYIIKHSFSDHTGFNFFQNLPQNTTAFNAHYKSELLYESSIYTEEEIKRYKEKLLNKQSSLFQFNFVPVKFYFINYLKNAVRFTLNNYFFQKKYGTNNIATKVLSGNYTSTVNYNEMFGEDKLKKLHEILNFCSTHKKSIYFISIPSKPIVELDSLHYHNNLYNRHLKALNQEFSSQFFDGYVIFDSIPRENIDEFVLHGDDHWNRKGIDLFVKCLSKTKNEFK